MMHTGSQVACHLHTCETPSMAYCQERATDMVEMHETGAWLAMCPDHMLEAMREEWGDPMQPIPAADPDWIIA